MKRRSSRAALALLLASICSVAVPCAGIAAVTTGSASTVSSSTGAHGSNSLEAAAAKAGQTGRAVAMSLIGLGFAIAAVVLAFRRDFKEAAGVFAVGLVAVLLATPTGVTLLQDTVTSLFGSQ